MANIQQLKIGDGDPDRIMFDKYYTNPNNYKFDFTTWVLNDVGHDVTIENNRITIKKFVPNTWIIRSEAVTGYRNSAICTYCRGTVMTSSNISTWASTLFASQLDTSNNQGAGSDTPKFRGLVMYPMSIESDNSYWMPQRVYTWEATWIDGDDISTSTRSGAAIADWADFRLGSGGHGVYGIWSDFTQTTMFPDTLLDVNNWSRANYGYDSSGTWYYAIGLYSGDYPNVGEGETGEVIDISDNPITLELYDNGGVDVSTVECWDAYAGDEQVYHKDRTVYNCWVQYGMGQENSRNSDGKTIYYISLDMSNIPEEVENPMLPEVVDWEDYIMNNWNSGKYVLNWNCDLTNSPMHDTVKEWFSSHAIPVLDATNYDNNTSDYTKDDNCYNFIYSYPFKNLKVNGNFKIILDGYFNTLSTNRAGFGLSCDKFTIQCLQDNCTWTSMNTMFYNSSFSELEVLDADGNVFKGFFSGTDFSGAFEFNGNITEIPDDIIAWGGNRNNVTTNEDGEAEDDGSYFGYCFEMCNSLTRVGMYGSTRESEDNTVRAFDLSQTFNWCTNLTYIGPVLDLSYVNFYTDGSTAYPYLAFNQCSKLEDVRIKNLNGSYVDFATDSTSGHGNLSSLNQESVEYLFNNLTDLTTYDQYDHTHDDEEHYIYGKPLAEAGEIHCPSEWASYVTTAMITAANAKGWTIYIGDNKVSLNK